MQQSNDKFAAQLLLEVARRRTSAFTGLGVVFYGDSVVLPDFSISLGHGHIRKPSLPILGMSDIAETLSACADAGSPWHDGFHLVDVHMSSLTHLSQFLSPPLSGAENLPEDIRPAGARQMTAILVSLISGIECVGLLSTDDSLSVYREGRVSFMTMVSHA